MISGPREREHSRQWELLDTGPLGKCSRTRKQAWAAWIGLTPETEGNELGARTTGAVSRFQVILNAQPWVLQGGFVKNFGVAIHPHSRVNSSYNKNASQALLVCDAGMPASGSPETYWNVAIIPDVNHQVSNNYNCMKYFKSKSYSRYIISCMMIQ